MKNLSTINSKSTKKEIAPERIIQFGEGNFMRAFADWMVARMNKEADFNTSVVIVKPRQHGSLQKFTDQDCLYTVNVQGLDNSGMPVDTVEVVDSVSRCINPYEDFEAFIQLADIPDVRFVFSNTTEAGICYDASCHLNDKPASSYPAKLTQLLYRRYKSFSGNKTKGLIIMPCELIFHNGNRLKDCIEKHIEDWRVELAEDYEGFKKWFYEDNYVCNTLVDRIVTGYPKQGTEELFERIGYEDLLLVQCEYFHFWAIEPPKNISCESLMSEFPAHKANLNVLFTENESSYHERKVKLLNAPHTILSPVAYLSGIDIVRDACKDDVVGAFIKKAMTEELIPTLDMDINELQDFASAVLNRFCNPYIDHQLTSIMLNSFPKFKERDLPALLTYKERMGALPECIILGLAAIIVYYKGGVRTDGITYKANDAVEIIEHLTTLWASNNVHDVVSGVLKAKDLIWKEQGDLSQIEGLSEKLVGYVSSILNNGMINTIKTIL